MGKTPFVVGQVEKPRPEFVENSLAGIMEGVWPELVRQSRRGELPLGDVLKALTEHRNIVFPESPEPPAVSYAGFVAQPLPPRSLINWHAGWPKYLQDYYGIRLASLPDLPAYQSGFNLSIVVPSLTPETLHELCKARQHWGSTVCLDSIITEGRPKSTYAVLCRDGVEPDADLMGKSARMVKKQMVATMTFLERMILGDRLAIAARSFLDVSGWTITSSFLTTGEIVIVRYQDGVVKIDKMDLGWTHPKSGVRVVIL